MSGSTGTTTITCFISPKTLVAAFFGQTCICYSSFRLFPSRRDGWVRTMSLPRPQPFMLLMAAIAYIVLQRAIINQQGRNSLLAFAIGGDWKGKLSLVLDFIAIPLAFVS